MPALLFPSDDVLRLILAAGVIPPGIASAPVSAAFDLTGRVWADVPADFILEGLTTFQRFGVRVETSGELDTHRYLNWYQLISLRPAAAAPPGGPILLDVPVHTLAAVGRIVFRDAKPMALRFHAEPPGPQHCRVELRDLTPALRHFLESHGEIRGYSSAAAGVWVRHGWVHPLAKMIEPAPGTVVLLDPEREWRQVAARPDYRSAAEFRYDGSPPPQPAHPVALSPIAVPLSLRRGRAGREEMWVLRADGEATLRDFLKHSDERVLRACRVATVREAGGERRVLVRAAGSAMSSIVTASDAAGLTEHAGIPGLYLPTDQTLVPAARRDKLAAALVSQQGGFVWLGPRPEGGFATNRSGPLRFRPASELIEYTAPAVRRLDSSWGGGLFQFEAVVGVAESDPPPEPKPPTAHTPGSGSGSIQPGGGWLSRSLDQIAKRLRSRRPSAAVRNGEREGGPAGPAIPAEGDSHVTPPGSRDLSARRAELEGRLIHDLPALSPDEQAALWAGMAELAAATAGHTDAALGFANAIWEAGRPRPEWFEGWLRAEMRAAKVGHQPEELGEALTLTTRRVSPRLVAAYLAWCGARPSPPSDLAVRLPRLIELLESRAAKLPIRIAWLGRLAAAALAEGDPLGLARWRDAVFLRLAEVGPTLDLDAPGFVRFHGRPGGDRYRAARDWLLRMRDPTLRWLARQASPRRLQWFGLDPETEATAGYIDLLFAWGASRLGERNTSRDWEEAAAGVLARPPGSADAGVHGVLLAAYRHRIREAQQGRPERPGLPAEVAPAYRQLSDFQRYAVDKLRRVSGILEPTDRVNPYHGRDVAEVFGSDAIGMRLRGLYLPRDEDDLDREVRSLLAAAETDPLPGTLARVVTAAVTIAPRLPTNTALDVLGRVPAAVRLIPEWFWATRGLAGAAGGSLEDCLGRFLDAAAHAATALDTPGVLRDLARYFAGPTAPPVPITQAALGPIAGGFFRALRRSGLRAEAETLLARVTPPANDDVLNRVGFAVGWLAVGNDEAATQLLDQAREQLFSVGPAPGRARTRLVVAYAAAVGHAPRIALGRLEEIVQRFDGIHTLGSTNRFFTAAVLELVDTIIRSVVSDDFALGPEIRGWLDDHEFGTRRRISRDLDVLLANAGLTAAGIPGPDRGR